MRVVAYHFKRHMKYMYQVHITWSIRSQNFKAVDMILNSLLVKNDCETFWSEQ